MPSMTESPGRASRALLVVVGASVTVLVLLDGSLAGRALRALVVLAMIAGAVVLPARHRGVAVGHALLGALSLAIGIGFLPHLVKAPDTITGYAALGAAAGGLALVVVAMARVLRPMGWPRRVAGGLLALVVAAICLSVVGPAVAVNNVPATALGDDPSSRGLDHEDVTLTTADDVRLAAWYVPSANGAAVVLRHGAGSTRSNVLDQAEVLARHGYGVLMVDARGHGDSEGRAMDFGWWGDLDIEAATRHLAQRVDVDPARIGVVGMSMGGEEAIGAAASDTRIHAVVAEGATARTAADKDWLSEVYGVRGWLQEQLDRLQFGLADLLGAADAPTALRDAVEQADGVAFLLIAAGEVAEEGHAATHIAAGAPDRVEVWTVPGAGHTDGLDVEPDDWERRVVGFLDAHL